MSWVIKHWVELAVFHEHKSLLVFISYKDKICPLCLEKEPEEIIFQEQLLGGNHYSPTHLNIVDPNTGNWPDTTAFAILPYLWIPDPNKPYRIAGTIQIDSREKVFFRTVKELIKEFKEVDL